MNKKAELKLLHETWFKIERVLESLAWGQYPKQYKALLYSEAKQHDKLRPYDCKRGISIKDEMCLFAVNTIVRALSGEQKPVIADFLHCQHSWLYAHALVSKYEAELRQALEGVNFKAIDAIDYCELIKA